MRLEFSERSLLHLADIRAYIGADRPDAAELVRGRIIASIRSLQELPRLGRVGRKQGTRELVVAGLPYIIVYRIDIGDADQLVILGVFHVARER